MEQYDLITIGAGSGGLAATIRAAKHGAKCLIIEKSYLGGTCVNLGCVPKKVMWFAANLAEKLEDAKHFGFDINVKDFDFKYLIQQRQAYIDRIHKFYNKKLEEENINLVQGSAKLLNKNTIEVNDKQYSAKHIIIATGGYPFVPKVKGSELGITSDGFFELNKVPKKVAIIGAGYIAVEIAGILNSLGSQVTLVYRGKNILKGFDTDIAEHLESIMHNKNITLMPEHEPKEIRKKEACLELHCKNEVIIENLEKVIFATGRLPNTQDLNLNNAGIKHDEKGHIYSDEYENTNQKNIYALGDITNKVPLTPVAVAAGRALSERLFNNKKEAKIDYDNIPSVIFSHPPIGTIGLSEKDAIAKYGEKQIKVYTTKFVDMSVALTTHKTKTFIKIITLGESEKVIGCHLIGNFADEILQGFAVAIKNGATKKDLDNTIAIHPTSAEEIVTLT